MNEIEARRARNDITAWLVDAGFLSGDKKRDHVEVTETFDCGGKNGYAFRYRTGSDGPWYLAAAGGYGPDAGPEDLLLGSWHNEYPEKGAADEALNCLRGAMLSKIARAGTEPETEVGLFTCIVTLNENKFSMAKYAARMRRMTDDAVEVSYGKDDAILKWNGAEGKIKLYRERYMPKKVENLQDAMELMNSRGYLTVEVRAGGYGEGRTGIFACKQAAQLFTFIVDALTHSKAVDTFFCHEVTLGMESVKDMREGALLLPFEFHYEPVVMILNMEAEDGSGFCYTVGMGNFGLPEMETIEDGQDWLAHFAFMGTMVDYVLQEELDLSEQGSTILVRDQDVVEGISGSRAVMGKPMVKIRVAEMNGNTPE